ncbi:MAG TPA: glucokinase, partial [Gammaproteobacteria bacterium]|nr:glucokinase [Gammaproteobacteria bacterium]
MTGPGRLLAGDIGGTKTLLRLAEPQAGEPAGRCLHEARYDSGGHDDLAPMVEAFLTEAGGPAPAAACFGVAGPVEETGSGQSARLTNLPWHLDSAKLARRTGIGRVRLINDFQAVGYGIEALAADDLAPLQGGTPEPGAPRLVVGAGTGLGVGLLFHNGDHYEARPTEAGHADFAPTDERQVRLWRALAEQYGRVSNERVVSGPGIGALYRFLLRENGRATEDDPVLTAPDPAAAVSERAVTGGEVLANEALDLFCQVYGAVTGNLALTCLAHGGVFIAGGIAPRILPRLQSGGFLAGFTGKGRMGRLLETM